MSNLKYRQSIVKYAKRYSVTRASMNFNVSHTFIYKLISRYDGSLGLLKPYSNRPHHHPRQSTNEEYQLIRNYIKRHPYIGLTILWIKLRHKLIQKERPFCNYAKWYLYAEYHHNLVSSRKRSIS